jgi:Transposase domain (DUF772)
MQELTGYRGVKPGSVFVSASPSSKGRRQLDWRRGQDQRREGLFSYMRPESRIPANHPLCVIRRFADEALTALDAQFAALYAENGRPSIPPEQLLRALLLQAFYTIRSEHGLISDGHTSSSESRGDQRPGNSCVITPVACQTPSVAPYAISLTTT